MSEANYADPVLADEKEETVTRHFVMVTPLLAAER